MAKNVVFLPLNSILAKGYAASDDNIKFKITVKNATIKLFITYFKIGTSFKTSLKFAKVGLSGKNIGGYAKMFSLAPFIAVEVSQIKGNKHKKQTKINIEKMC